ncbi:MAG: alpha/beta fold hydrolase [Deltaproteobacteria bacterium]|nr:alpha/beta fold hydrolase [Deltaproteobacteria bacterium]
MAAGIWTRSVAAGFALVCLAACSGGETVLGRIDATDAADGDESSVEVDGDDGGGDADADDAAGDDGSADADDGGGPPVVVWEECPLRIDGTPPGTAECAVVELPLNGTAPDGRTIGIRVQRVRAVSPRRKGQVWLLDGGGAGVVFGQLIQEFASLDPRWDWYAPDHRGAGGSDRLGCPEQEDLASEGGFEITPSEWDGCIAHLRATWGDDLAHYTTTNAARDLGTLIELLREPGEDVFLFGHSIATYTIFRYLQLHPDRVTGVVLDTILPPGTTMPEVAFADDANGETIFGLCGADPLCSSKLGPDPWATVTRVFDELEAGSCPGFSALLPEPWGERWWLRRLLFGISWEWFLRPFMPAVVYRLDRCDAADVEAVAQMLPLVLLGPPAPESQQISDSLLTHVVLSEMWPEPPPDAATLVAALDRLLFFPDIVMQAAEKQDRWPTYERDAYVGGWPTTEVPMLMMEGALCGATAVCAAHGLADHFDGPYQYHYELPRSPCRPLLQSVADTPTGLPCGEDLFFQFIDNPLVEPDASCVDEMYPLDFAGNPDHSMTIFGTSDLWENGGT